MVETVLELQNVVTKVQGKILHDHVNLEVEKGEILGIVGGSGSGKSVLLKVILGLMSHAQGKIKIFGIESSKAIDNTKALSHKYSVLFQSGALFSSLTVIENIYLFLQQLTNLGKDLLYELAMLRLQMVGLAPDVANKYPSELSGGMIKRVALARALAVDAEMIFLDEPTAGLDPIAAEGFDELLKSLQRMLGLTIIIITHDLDLLYSLCGRVAILVDKKIISGTIKELSNHSHPWIYEYFNGRRGRSAKAQHS